MKAGTICREIHMDKRKLNNEVKEMYPYNPYYGQDPYMYPSTSYEYNPYSQPIVQDSFRPPNPPPRPPQGGYGPPPPPSGPPPYGGGQYGGPAQGGGPPTAPPPAFVPQLSQVSTQAIDAPSMRGCLYRYTYVWLRNRRSFWFYPTYVGRNSVAGYRWRESSQRWSYFGIDADEIRSFQCY